MKFFYSNKQHTCLLLCLLFIPIYAYSKTINPLDYGLSNAKTGEERFWVLYRTHELANTKHWNVSYKGIEQIELDIPSDAIPIPLSNYTDFCNTQFFVSNTKIKNYYLFELSQQQCTVEVTKEMIDAGDFRNVRELSGGKKLLIIEDKNPWVVNRSGRNYGVFRRDVLLLRGGRAINKTISPYNNDYSEPHCKYVVVSGGKKIFKNIIFHRTDNSCEKTFLLKVRNQNNVLLDGLKIITPDPITMVGDIAIMVENCTKVYFSNIKINGTYSLSNSFGYGIALDNVWDSYFDNIESTCAWGVFGNNNVNTVHMKNSSVNRFDAHCYARDFSFFNCEFSLVGLNQSSFMGNLIFEQCTFNHADVCDSRDDYNAYTPFTIIMKDCTLLMDRGHSFLVRLNEVPLDTNTRFELQKKYSPSIVISRSKVILDEQVSVFCLYQLGFSTSDNPFYHWGSIIVDNLGVVGDNKKMMFVNRNVNANNVVKIDLKEIEFSDINNKFSYINGNGVNNNTKIDVNINSSRGL